MFFSFKFFFRKKQNKGAAEIAPDEIFLDSSNLPKFNTYQMEGRFEKPISQNTIYITGAVFLAVAIIFTGKAWSLQIKNGDAYAAKSENNHLKQRDIFAERGIIFDRNGITLVSNENNKENSDFPKRKYIEKEGFSHLLGYVKYPQKDGFDIYYTNTIEGKDGVEKAFDEELAGQNGTKIYEVDALGALLSESVQKPPKNGRNLILSVDSHVQEKLFEYMRETIERIGFTGGAGAFMNVKTGEILALVSFPEYSSDVMTEGKNSAKIRSYSVDKSNPFLNRAIDGLYTPGSTIKPYIALGALNEKIIDPLKTIVSAGSISIPNKYNPEKKTFFMDWKVHGAVDMKKALAVSSNVYFYEIGGGFESQPGLGISNIEKYVKMFGFGREINDKYLGGQSGIIPNPAWKALNFDGEGWFIGDTYNTSVGQYGFQVTLIQTLRSMAAVANDGLLLSPTVLKIGKEGNPERKTSEPEKINIPYQYFKVVKEGMREGVLGGTAQGLNLPNVAIAAKTGTAELGAAKKFVNSWVVGFFPYENPKYVFAAIMEKGPRENIIGALYVMKQIIDWMSVYTPEYVK